jgi:hypothetical protein
VGVDLVPNNGIVIQATQDACDLVERQRLLFCWS